MYGFQVYTSEVDDRGIDFVARYEAGPFFTVQVKSIRKSGYVFLQKDKFQITENSYLALVMLDENVAPDIYLIPALAWRSPDELFVDRDYIGLKSKAEWGLNLSMKNRALLLPYKIDAIANEMHRS